MRPSVSGAGRTMAHANDKGRCTTHENLDGGRRTRHVRLGHGLPRARRARSDPGDRWPDGLGDVAARPPPAGDYRLDDAARGRAGTDPPDSRLGLAGLYL